MFTEQILLLCLLGLGSDKFNQPGLNECGKLISGKF
jgi:hypothetical protein